VFEPHTRGSILVAAVFDAFFSVYSNQIRDLIRIATGGTGNLPDADLHPDLVNRVATEASRIAQSVLTACIRAFDYLPPVDITFGDYLRALVTADFESSPQDETGLRAALIDAFHRRGINLENVRSRAEESMRWELAPKAFPAISLEQIMTATELLFALSTVSRDAQRRSTVAESDQRFLMEIDVSHRLAAQLHSYASQNYAALLLDPNVTIAVVGFHPVFRVASGGQLLVELVAQFQQEVPESKQDFGGIPLRGGTTIIAAGDGRVKYVIARPLPTAAGLDEERRKAAERRKAHQQEHLQFCDLTDPMDAVLRH
jgi:hypothetical protein